ncbi:MAG: hypothetical protein KAI40_06430 [Desulfobacterales bacterium]|nr:hypothetical protein [Desulfobacterales bacterium]
MKNNDAHLTEDQIIVSVIDKNDLDTSTYQHLQDCSLCKKQNLELELRLNGLSKKAENLIKPPQLNIMSVFSEKKKCNTYKKPFIRLLLRPALSFAVIVLCALSIFYLLGSRQSIMQDSLTTGPLSTETLLTEIDSDLKFAETMDNLEDYALSGFITSSDDQNYNLDEFIEFVTLTSNETI